MKKFTTLDGLVVPLDRANVDTDAIIPKQFLKSIKRTGFGPNLFDEWRYLDQGVSAGDNAKRVLNPEFSLNFPRYVGATILLTRKNFGCGSSREHAPWALEQYGFRAIIAPSFADIFFNNCYKNGLLPIVLTEEQVDHLFKLVNDNVGFRLNVDLDRQLVTASNGDDSISYPFAIDDFRKYCMSNGLDDIDLTLRQREAIKSFEEQHLAKQPWLKNTI